VSGNSKDRKFFCGSLEHQGKGKFFFFFFFQKETSFGNNTGVFCTEGDCWRFLAIMGVGSHNDTQSIFFRVSTPATPAFLILLVTLLMVYNPSTQLLQSPMVYILEAFSLYTTYALNVLYIQLRALFLH
jgi:hypothetical protein